MESKQKVGCSSSSSSSFIDDLFGSKESTQPSASTGTFASMFPPPSGVVGRNSSYSVLTGYTQKPSSENYVWGNKQETADVIAKKSANNKGRKSIFLENVEPCPLSSSLCYGGKEDMYINSSSTRASGGGSYPIFKKDEVEDDPNGNNSQSACRGNWWQGSLYY